MIDAGDLAPLHASFRRPTQQTCTWRWDTDPLSLARADA